ncbi:MAG: hypothetical protein U0229_17425 [Anaeromyxobacter sp.]
MTLPRQVLPGKTYLFTRRTLQRLFLLTPTPTVSGAFGYVLALVAEKYGIQIHAYCVLSNHYHLVLTDPKGVLPWFAQELNANLARFLNTHHGRFESAWAPGSYSAVTLHAEEDVVAKAAYTLANPVAAGLVEHGRLWPGLWSAPEWIGGEPRTFERPDVFFDEFGVLPDEVELPLVPPPGRGAEAFRKSLEGALAELERQAKRNEDGTRRKFVGGDKVRRQRWWQHPGGRAPAGELNPRVAARDKWRRIQALQDLQAFWDAYEEALEKFCNGLRQTVFPPGTWLMHVNVGAARAPAS